MGDYTDAAFGPTPGIMTMAATRAPPQPLLTIRTPDQRLRVFVSSSLEELAVERTAAREAVTRLRLTPVLFELGARSHPPRDLYRAYLEQSDIFVGIYGQRYGWVALGQSVSGLEDEYRLSGKRPKLIYIKRTEAGREPGLDKLLDRIRSDDIASYREFSTAQELQELIENDLAILLTERFERTPTSPAGGPGESTASNLPVPRSPIVGRDPELAAACDLLRGADAHLVTLTGPGGCGKSRLGLAVALELRAHFEDGAYLVMLESIRDPTMVITAIAETLGVREVPGQPRIETLSDYLHEAHALLMLDNFEHVVQAASTISMLLESCPRLAVLATSRTPLRVRGEVELAVPPLQTPAAYDFDPHSLSQYGAVELFLQRAGGIRPDFVLTDENAPAIAEICHRLDGLPLAIELAAARLKILSPDALLGRLASRFDVLRGGTRDLPDRHRTLRGAIQWSHDLLGEVDRRMFRRLGIFAGGCTIEAAEAVCSLERDVEAEAFELIASLLDSSMLTTSVGDDGDIRIRMLNTIRAYAMEQLVDSGEIERVQRNHAEFYLAFAEQVQPSLVGADELRWIERLCDERDNFRQTLDWSAGHDVELGLRLCAALWRFWECSAIVEGHDRVTELLSLPSAPTVVRAKALKTAAALACYLGEYDSARAYLEEAHPIFEESGDKRDIAMSLNERGLLASHEGAFVTARRLLNESLAIKRELGDERLIANALLNLGLVAGWEGDYVGASGLARGSLELFRSRGDQMGVASATGNLAHAAMHLGRLDEARSLQIESLRLFHERYDADGLAEGIERLGMLANARSDHSAAARLFGLAAVLREKAGTLPALFDRAVLERELSATRDRLDPATFDAEWQSGREMSVDEAIELTDAWR